MGNSCCISPFPGVIPGFLPAGTRQPQLFPSTSKHPNPSYRFLPIPATLSDHQDQSSSWVLWPNRSQGGPSQTHLKMGCSPNLSQPGESSSQQTHAGSGMDELPLAGKAGAPQKCNHGQAAIKRVCGELGTFLPRRTQTLGELISELTSKCW